MIQVRQNMFETNSSSVHVLVMMKSSDFARFSKSEEDYDSLEDIVFWNRRGSGIQSSEQKFKTGKEFIDEMNSEGLIDASVELDLNYLKKYANNHDYFTFDQTVEEMDEYASVNEGDITAFSFSGRD